MNAEKFPPGNFSVRYGAVHACAALPDSMRYGIDRVRGILPRTEALNKTLLP
jgi:hypothetical protein